MKLRRLVAVAALAATLGAVPACSRPAPAGPTAPTARGTGAVVGDWQGVGRFADALMGDDLATAKTFVVPGSPADRYLAYQADFIAAAPQVGRASPGTWAVNVDQHLGQVTIAMAGAPALTWTDWRFGPDGKILQWSTPNLGELEARLATPGPATRLPGGTVRVASALRNEAVLNVVLEVTPTGAALAPDCAATYAAPAAAADPAPASAAPGASPAASSPLPADACLHAGSQAPGKASKVALQFAGAGLGGTLTYTLRDAAGASHGVARLTVA